jgi:ParB-like chromosome segregation protein Spo0J
VDIRRLPIAQLTPAHYNPRKDLKPGDEEYELLKKGIGEFGLVEPLVWNEATGRIVGGHQRLKVLIANGETEADVSVVHIEDEAREKALNIALNKVGGDWDRPALKDLLETLDCGQIDMELTGFTEDALASLMSEVHIPDEEPEYDESIADDVKRVTCPECGHEFPV